MYCASLSSFHIHNIADLALEYEVFSLDQSQLSKLLYDSSTNMYLWGKKIEYILTLHSARTISGTMRIPNVTRRCSFRVGASCLEIWDTVISHESRQKDTNIIPCSAEESS